MKKSVSMSVKTFALLSILLLLAAGTVAAADDKPKEIILGGITALSGPAAPWGIGMQNTWQMAVDDINNGGWWWKKKGITVNGQKYKFKLQVYDHAFDASKAVSAANRLISRDGVKYILAFDGGMIKAFQPISEKSQGIYSGLCLTGQRLHQSKRISTPGCMASTAWHRSFSIPGSKKIRTTSESPFSSRIIGPGTPPPKRLASGYPKPNLKLCLMNSFPADTTDFYPILTRMLRTKPDLIDIGNVDPASRALFVKQAREMGFKGPMYLITPDVANLKNVAGWENCEGLYFLPYETALTGAEICRRNIH